MNLFARLKASRELRIARGYGVIRRAIAEVNARNAEVTEQLAKGIYRVEPVDYRKRSWREIEAIQLESIIVARMLEAKKRKLMASSYSPASLARANW